MTILVYWTLDGQTLKADTSEATDEVNRKADTSEATDGVKRAFAAHSEPNSDFRLRTPTSFLGTGLSSVASDFTLGSFKV